MANGPAGSLHFPSIFKVLGVIKWEEGSLLISPLLLDTGASSNAIGENVVPGEVHISSIEDACRLIGATSSDLDIVGYLEVH